MLSKATRVSMISSKSFGESVRTRVRPVAPNCTRPSALQFDERFAHRRAARFESARRGQLPRAVHWAGSWPEMISLRKQVTMSPARLRRRWVVREGRGRSHALEDGRQIIQTPNCRQSLKGSCPFDFSSSSHPYRPMVFRARCGNAFSPETGGCKRCLRTPAPRQSHPMRKKRRRIPALWRWLSRDGFRGSLFHPRAAQQVSQWPAGTKSAS